MKDCNSVRESLGVWLDGELGRFESEAVRFHLENCPACDAERRQLEKLELSLKGILVAEAPRLAFEPFWSALEARINQKRAWHEDLLEWFRWTFTAPRLAWAVPAVILLLLGALSLDSLFPGWRPGAQRNNFASVESIDGYGRNVALLREDETRTTVIWLYHNPEGENESTGETGDTRPSF